MPLLPDQGFDILRKVINTKLLKLRQINVTADYEQINEQVENDKDNWTTQLKTRYQ